MQLLQSMCTPPKEQKKSVYSQYIFMPVLTLNLIEEEKQDDSRRLWTEIKKANSIPDSQRTCLTLFMFICVSVHASNLGYLNTIRKIQERSMTSLILRSTRMLTLMKKTEIFTKTMKVNSSSSILETRTELKHKQH